MTKEEAADLLVVTAGTAGTSGHREMHARRLVEHSHPLATQLANDARYHARRRVERVELAITTLGIQ